MLRFNSPEWGEGSSPVKNGASPDWIIVVVVVVMLCCCVVVSSSSSYPSHKTPTCPGSHLQLIFQEGWTLIQTRVVHGQAVYL